MSDSGNKYRFEHWRSGFEENLKHEPSAASRSRKEAQLQQLQLWKETPMKDIDQEATSLEAGLFDAEIPESDNQESNCIEKSSLAWPKSVSSEDHLLELMVKEMEAITSVMFKDLQALDEGKLLKQLESVRNSVVKFVDENYRTLMTKSVLKSFYFLSNVHLNRIGAKNQERRTNRTAIDGMLKKKVSGVVNILQAVSITKFQLSIETGVQLLELNALEKKTLELLGVGWVQYYCKSKEIIAKRLSRYFRHLDIVQDKLMNLPVGATAELDGIYQKTVQSISDDLKCDTRLDDLIPAVQQVVEKLFKSVQERAAIEQGIVLKAKEYACDRYLELMLRRAETVGKLGEVIPVHFEVREMVEVAFFTVPAFMYSLLWNFDFRDEDLIARFRKERLNRFVSAGVAPENSRTETSAPESTNDEESTQISEELPILSSRSHHPGQTNTLLTEPLVTASESRDTPSSSLPGEQLVALDLTQTDETLGPPPDRRNNLHVIQQPESDNHQFDASQPVICSVYSLPKKSVRIAMYFSMDSLNIMYKIDGASNKSVFPLTMQMAHNPEGELTLVDLEKHDKIINLNLSAYIRCHNVRHLAGFRSLDPEVTLAVFIRKCMHQIHKIVSTNLYDACVALALPASILSSCRFRVKTALKLAGFRDSIIVQASTALATSYAAKTGPTSSEPYQLLTVFVDDNDIEVTLIEVAGGWQMTSLLVKVISIPPGQVLKPQNILDAIYEFNYAVDCVFCMSPTNESDFVPFCQALHVQRSFGRVVCVPLFVGLLPGLLNISSGRTRYQERFPWEITVGRNRFLLAQQNDLIRADSNPRLVLRFSQIEGDGDTVAVHRRDAISRKTVMEEVSLHDVQNLFKLCPHGDITVEVSKEGLVTLDFHSQTQAMPRIMKDTRHMATNDSTLRNALKKVDKMASDFPNPDSCSSSSLRRRLSEISSQEESTSLEKIIRID